MSGGRGNRGPTRGPGTREKVDSSGNKRTPQGTGALCRERVSRSGNRDSSCPLSKTCGVYFRGHGEGNPQVHPGGWALEALRIGSGAYGALHHSPGARAEPRRSQHPEPRRGRPLRTSQPRHMAPSRVGRDAGQGRHGRTVNGEMLARVRAAVTVVLRQEGLRQRPGRARRDEEADAGSPRGLAFRSGSVPGAGHRGQPQQAVADREEVRKVVQAQGLTRGSHSTAGGARGPSGRCGSASRATRPSSLAYATQWVSKRGRARRPLDVARKRCRRSGMAERFPPRRPGEHLRPNRPQNILQAGVPVVRDPDRVRLLAAGKRDENADLRAFLKWEGRRPSSSTGSFTGSRPRSARRSIARSAPAAAGSWPRPEGEGRRTAGTPAPGAQPGVPEGSPPGRRRGSRVRPDALSPPRRDPVLVYRDRPEDCHSYPHLHKKDMTRRLLGVLGNAGVCPSCSPCSSASRRSSSSEATTGGLAPRPPFLRESCLRAGDSHRNRLSRRVG